jgi:hypothetical protein
VGMVVVKTGKGTVAVGWSYVVDYTIVKMYVWIVVLMIMMKMMS